MTEVNWSTLLSHRKRNLLFRKVGRDLQNGLLGGHFLQLFGILLDLVGDLSLPQPVGLQLRLRLLPLLLDLAQLLVEGLQVVVRHPDALVQRFKFAWW